ncbi:MULTISPECIES: TetR/AcrR family transcriptional regulator [unclassified Mesorhizobium]|uniref:TetR/AcrR family transcriptional regulator n=1 Tax=unclassified Mesorhizobium TaxID=325217 RepID=UPI001091B02E|nr:MULTISPECIES: TetR/AcrR family transcriptional regulator [unclassified Mesorhizobium]TIS95364.1 MAG: TetR/AcrR family transcriptional regulator [Mesorhizobium sp.]TGP89838.1 TetR/AcrR family transcriptional regulator [Mesorhizobium sp. M8A.F.Ca.ET.218.01.1.1]TGS48599.1 TetR/AcrR family transcriptional regulator [Mesorhizobium sp. M8A.F.Ca.ET.182.01.1.1]TGS83109.1 TetR/AcrR family transcriptional regulator [Mesorhizobium sp. M8A.F.Ca.ET.181.01.1.1]TGT16330.1 TetR/AcrR family transcriptional 
MRYEKGRKDASRGRIMEVATQRFRSDGIAASGLASIMSDAGLTNGAFYPHFPSKAALVRECVAAALEGQSGQIAGVLASGGLETAIDAYLSAQHRDNPGMGCASAALLPEIAREQPETRQLYTERLMTLVRQVSAALPPHASDPEAVAFGILATLIGALQLARAVEGAELSDRILAAGADAARSLAQPRGGDAAQ